MDMDNTFILGKHRGHSNLNRLLLLLFLSGLHPVLSTDGESHEVDDKDLEGRKIDCKIAGPDYVTVGVPTTVECVSNCSACTYSMSLDGQRAQGQGNVLAFTVNSWVDALTVKCTVTDDKTRRNASTTKELQVLAGPANISITGPNLMNPTVGHTYSCHANCRPSCAYAWKIDKGPWISGQSNVISVTPGQEMDVSSEVICKAINTVSGLFVSDVRKIEVISGPSHVQIKGPDVIQMGEEHRFECTAKCLPSCRYVTSVNNQTVRGNMVELTVDEPIRSFVVKCEAQNTASRKTAITLKTVCMAGLNRNLSTRPEGTSVVMLMAFTISAAFTL